MKRPKRSTALLGIDELPFELREYVFIWYRVKLRRRLAQRRLVHTMMRHLTKEINDVFTFCNGDYRIVLGMLLGRIE
tara:strand:+ start:248 stop:478 length:231 start_codon:yes stop_codon:yes gene_type:complete